MASNYHMYLLFDDDYVLTASYCTKVDGVLVPMDLTDYTPSIVWYAETDILDVEAGSFTELDDTGVFTFTLVAENIPDVQTATNYKMKFVSDSASKVPLTGRVTCQMF